MLFRNMIFGFLYANANSTNVSGQTDSIEMVASISPDNNL